MPRNRIFTINSNAEVSLDLLSLNKLKLSYVNMTEVVDHYFPPVSTLVKGGGEDYTDFKYWRDTPLELDEFSASESDVEDAAPGVAEGGDRESHYAEEDEEEEEEEEDEDEDEEDLNGELGDSYISRDSVDEEENDDDEVEDSVLSGSYEGEEQTVGSMIEDEEDDADDEGDEGDEDEGPPTAAEAYIKTEMMLSPADGEASKVSNGSSPPRAVVDVSTEMITGVKGLAIGEEEGQA